MRKPVGRFSAIFDKRNIFCVYLFTFQYTKFDLKMRQQREIFPSLGGVEGVGEFIPHRVILFSKERPNSFNRVTWKCVRTLNNSQYKYNHDVFA